jgi:ribonuclease P/MRP protein subunit RPP1
LRRFVDLQVGLPKSLEEAELLARHLKRLGFKAAALTVFTPQEVEVFQDLREVFIRQGIDILSRLNLKPKSSAELLEALRTHRKSFEIISVVCTGKQAARQAAKDHRVDTLMFPSRAIRLLDEAEAELARFSGVALEFSLSMLLELGGFLPPYLAEARRNVKKALRRGIPLVFSSGASDVYGLRAPRDLAAAAETLLELPESSGISTVSRSPMAIVERNRGKLNRSFVEPGVRLLEGGGHG